MSIVEAFGGWFEAHEGVLGARLHEDGRCSFRVWAPDARRVALELEGHAPVPLDPLPRGYHTCVVDNVRPGARYRVVVEPTLDSPAGAEPHRLPDPASRWQPEGVHGPSAVVDPRFDWHDGNWSGIPLAEWILYELHVGTFTPQGTFDAAIEALDRLVALGVTAIEVMPLAQFPGGRNWGYDGVGLFAVQNTYGGPQAFKRFVDACHGRGIAVVLDVVYNHLGPEGNYLDRFGPYFSEKYRTPWGRAINFDGGGSDEVRRFFIENALMWLDEFHVDGLRLDAVHGIVDSSPHPFLSQLAEAVASLGARTPWRRVLVAESDANDPRLVRPRQRGGMGLDGVWADDFHHALHAALTGEHNGYYCDYADLRLLGRAIEGGFAYTGQFSPYRNRSHGAPSDDLRPEAFVICTQNHDQVGNRAFGERMSTLVSIEAQRVAAGLLLCAPHTPLLFMGQEYGETRPFLYFTSHGDADLVDAVRSGRKREFASFAWSQEPPDPQAKATFERSRLEPVVREQSPHAGLERWHRQLIALRKTGEFRALRQSVACAVLEADTLCIRFGSPPAMIAIAHLGRSAKTSSLELPAGTWSVLLDSDDPAFDGRGNVLGGRRHAGGLRFTMPGHWFAMLRREPSENTA